VVGPKQHSSLLYLGAGKIKRMLHACFIGSSDTILVESASNDGLWWWKIRPHQSLRVQSLFLISPSKSGSVLIWKMRCTSWRERVLLSLLFPSNGIGSSDFSAATGYCPLRGPFQRSMRFQTATAMRHSLWNCFFFLRRENSYGVAIGLAVVPIESTISFQ
jgi:hypothetical protein